MKQYAYLGGFSDALVTHRLLQLQDIHAKGYINALKHCFVTSGAD
jgi:hypothetical protein